MNTAESTGTTYTVTFERIGRHHNVAPLVHRAADAGDLAAAIHRYARHFLLSGNVEVVVNLVRLSGSIMCGFSNGGSFALAVAPPAPVELLRAAADAVSRGPAQEHYRRAADDHEANGGLCPAGGNCWFEQQARDELAAVR
jgi:hypothetical protein